MPRNTSGIYALPSGTSAINGNVIDDTAFNALVDDLATDANAARPIGAGGTGATSAVAAAAALGVPSKTVAESIAEAWTWAVNKAVRFATTHSIFSDGTALRLRGNGSVFFQNADGTKNSLLFDPAGAVILYNNGVERLRTNAGGILVEGGASISGTISGAIVATQPQAEDPTLNDRIMTPLRTKQLIDAAFPFGASSQSFPGGLSFRFGAFSVAAGTGSSQVITFSPALPTALLGVVLTPSNAADQQMGYIANTRFGFTVSKGSSDAGARAGSWIAWGN